MEIKDNIIKLLNIICSIQPGFPSGDIKKANLGGNIIYYDYPDPVLSRLTEDEAGLVRSGAKAFFNNRFIGYLAKDWDYTGPGYSIGDVVRTVSDFVDDGTKGGAITRYFSNVDILENLKSDPEPYAMIGLNNLFLQDSDEFYGTSSKRRNPKISYWYSDGGINLKIKYLGCVDYSISIEIPVSKLTMNQFLDAYRGLGQDDHAGFELTDYRDDLGIVYGVIDEGKPVIYPDSMFRAIDTAIGRRKNIDAGDEKYFNSLLNEASIIVGKRLGDSHLETLKKLKEYNLKSRPVFDEVAYGDGIRGGFESPDVLLKKVQSDHIKYSPDKGLVLSFKNSEDFMPYVRFISNLDL